MFMFICFYSRAKLIQSGQRGMTKGRNIGFPVSFSKEIEMEDYKALISCLLLFLSRSSFSQISPTSLCYPIISKGGGRKEGFLRGEFFS